MCMSNLYQLIICAKRNCNSAKIALVEQFSPIITKYANKLSYEDAQQDLIVFFLELLPDIPERLNDDAEIISYIAKSIYHQYIKLAKKYFLNAEAEICIENLQDYIIGDNALNRVECIVLFKDLLSKLNEDCFRIIYLHYIKGYSIKEIADYFQVSRQEVNKSKNIALNILKGELVD